jgi:hypothetical protein
MKTMQWSSEQVFIFDWYREGSGHLVVEAFAGTGKTTTIKEAFSHAHEARILYAVFNKRNQKEAAQKITDPRVEVKTLHAVGFKIIKGWWSSVKPDSSAEYNRCMKAIGRDDKELIGKLSKVVAFVKNTILKATEASVAAMISNLVELNIDDSEVDYFARLAIKVLELSKVKPHDNLISFDDMVWLPVEMGWCKPSYDLVTVDEAQDMNLPQLTMARGICKGRMVVVGDSRQAIYGFRGAVQNGIGMMKLILKAATLNLTTTYRCPKSVVELAAQIVPSYKAAPEAPQGLVSVVPSADSAMPGDAILSRLNAPLMPLALSFLRKNIPARIEGRDIGRQLIGMIKSFKAKSVPDLISKIFAWEAKQVARLDGTKFAEKKIEQVRDIAQTLQALALDAKSVADVEQKVNGLFEDTDENSRPAVTLSSVHKAKGLEWNRVFLLCSTFRQSNGGEEANIYYVAVTRSKSELYLVGGNLPSPADKKPVAGTVAAPKQHSSLPPPRIKVEPLAPGRMHALTVSLSGIEDYDKEIDANPICRGDTFYRLGDLMVQRDAEYVCIRVSESSSLWRCRARKKVSYQDTKTGNQVEFESSAKGEIRICASHSDNCDRLSKEDFQEFLSGKVRAGSRTNSDNETTNNMKTKTEKKETDSVNKLDFIVSLVKAGKSEKEIKAEFEKTFGKIKAEKKPGYGGVMQAPMEYIIGREWRRENKDMSVKAAPKAKSPKAPAAKKVAAKPATKAPAKKAAPKAKAVSATPPPPKHAEEPTTEAPAEDLAPEAPAE